MKKEPLEFEKLLVVDSSKHLELSHFPNSFYAAVFRFWETVEEKAIAKALETSVENVRSAAFDMGLPPQKYIGEWKTRGYITTIKNAWHILPYEQILTLLDLTEDEFANILKNEDFLGVKLGGFDPFKPYCEKVTFTPLDDDGREKALAIKQTVKEHFGDLFDGISPFSFSYSKAGKTAEEKDGIRMIYSYCGLHAKELKSDISLSYPKELLCAYRDSGINAIWLPAVLYELTPFVFDENLSLGWEKRIERLNELIKLAREYGIKVYLYLNEPRNLPLSFFDSHPELLGASNGREGAMCTSVSAVMEYLRSSVRKLCESCPGLGGFFAITCSENLTHCKSNKGITLCDRCKEVPVEKLVADILCAISEESRKVDESIKTIAWTWAWDDFMTRDEICRCIDLLPKEIIIQSNSEAHKEFEIAGIKGEVRDYSMSIPGPAPLAEFIWDYAKEKGHEVSAKVQVNVTWECSTLPYLPVFDLVREHICALKKTGIQHLMLSWTLGGCPSPNLKLADVCLSDASEQAYDGFLKEEFGIYADRVKKAAKLFSDAFREFPFDIGNLYFGPQNAGPSNLLFLNPSGFSSTMTCFAYDDIDSWRSIYPKDVYICQLKKLSDGWKIGLEEIEDMPDCDFKYVAYGAYALFYSSYLQALFVDNREKNDKAFLERIVREEKENALLMYSLMQKNSFFGFEAANHYYFNKGMLAEKAVCCENILKKLNNSFKGGE